MKTQKQKSWDIGWLHGLKSVLGIKFESVDVDHNDHYEEAFSRASSLDYEDALEAIEDYENYKVTFHKTCRFGHADCMCFKDHERILIENNEWYYTSVFKPNTTYKEMLERSINNINKRYHKEEK